MNIKLKTETRPTVKDGEKTKITKWRVDLIINKYPEWSVEDLMDRTGLSEYAVRVIIDVDRQGLRGIQAKN